MTLSVVSSDSNIATGACQVVIAALDADWVGTATIQLPRQQQSSRPW